MIYVLKIQIIVIHTRSNLYDLKSVSNTSIVLKSELKLVDANIVNTTITFLQ